MARRESNVLTEKEVRAATAEDRRYTTLRDSEGLWLLIYRETGRKTWLFRMSINGRSHKKILGQYPEMSLREARQKRDELRSTLRRNGGAGIPLDTFEALVEDWFSRKIDGVRADSHARTVRSRLDRLILPYLGNKNPREITAPEVLAVLRRIEDRGHVESAHRVAQIIGQVFRFGIATGRADRDVAADLRGAIMPRDVRHYPTITDSARIGELMRAIHAFSGTVTVRCALLLQAFTATRPGETRLAEWREFDGDLWRIPAERMKKKRPHLVPLSRQAQSVLDELRPLTGSERLLFPSLRDKRRPMSDATVNAALRRMGYPQDEFTAHSFRSMFSTTANEHQWPGDAIELQLAHVEGNSVRAAYNHAEHLETRREMMQWWGGLA